MAIVRSHSMANGKKSAGMITYRTVRGRLIASQKRGGSDASRAAAYSNDGKLNVRCSAFAMINAYLAAHRESINKSFDKSTYGSAGNMFYTLNHVELEKALASLSQQGGTVSLSQITTAINTYATAHPDAIYRVKKAGYEIKYLTGDWNNADDPGDPTSITTMQASVSDQGVIGNVSVTGVNLASDMVVKVNSNTIAGSWNITANYTAGVFTPSSQSTISANATISVYRGTTLLKSVEVQGPAVVAVSAIDLTLDGRNITKATVTGSNLTADLKCKYNGNVVAGAWAVGTSASTMVFTPTTAIQREEGTKLFAVYKADGTTLLKSVETTYTAPATPKVTGVSLQSDYSSASSSQNVNVGIADDEYLYIVGTGLPTSGTTGFPETSKTSELGDIRYTWIAGTETQARVRLSNDGSSTIKVVAMKGSNGELVLQKFQDYV